MSALFLLLLADFRPALAEENESEEVNAPVQKVKIADPFIEIHTGPGASYPIIYVIDRGASVTIIRRRTDWFEIVAEDGNTGWASRDQMQQTLLPDGEKLILRDATEEDFYRRRWVLGVTGGELESAPVFTVFSAYSLTPNLAAEFAVGQSVGSVSSSTFWKGNLVMHPLPELTYSPYMTLGIGKITVSPSATLIVPSDESNTFSQFGFGFQRYISRRFMLRFEVNEYVIFSSGSVSDNNEEVSEWKAGFAVFF